MFKKLRLHIIISVAAIVWIIYAESTREKPINWFPSYSSQHKIPYGTYALRDLMPEFLKNSKVEDVRKPPYIKLKDTTLSGTYFFVDNAVNFGKDEMNSLLSFVARGNDVFISTLGANVDTLNLKTYRINTFNVQETLTLKLTNPNLDTVPYAFKKNKGQLGFKNIDSTKTEVLGKIRIYDQNGKVDVEKINFVRQKFGKGYFYFHLYPYAFTNYFVLKDSTRHYTESVLSYIDDSKPLLWDTYYKTGKSRISSPMYYVLDSKNLKWAYYSALIGVLLFVLFQGKRNQRFIPVITPLRNQTIAFAKTISSLHFERKDHKVIAEKYVFHLLDYIRTELRVPTNVIDSVFYDQVSRRSGNTMQQVENLFKRIDEIQHQSKITKEQLIELHTKIEEFKENHRSS